MSDYDAGLLNDFGAGDVPWWQDYIRAEIERANAHWRSVTDEATKENESLSAELAECIAALEKIANPISAMKRALPVGATLNGAMATTLSNDPSYLKEIAKAALAARKGEGE